jgi:hypothetical protein
VVLNGRHSSDTKERIARGVARYHAVRRESGRILPSDLVMIAQGNAPTRAALRPHVEDAAVELADLAVRRHRARAHAPALLPPPGESRATRQRIGRADTFLGRGLVSQSVRSCEKGLR